MRAGTGSTLEAAVADTVGAKVVELEDVISSDLDYDAFLAHRDLRRVSGIAVTAAGRLPWSLIEKMTAGPGPGFRLPGRQWPPRTRRVLLGAAR